jgi:hypothetical protein
MEQGRQRRERGGEREAEKVAEICHEQTEGEREECVAGEVRCRV